MKKIGICIFFLVTYMFNTSVFSSEQGTSILPLKVDVEDKARLQRGARMYMNYCSGCHSLQYMRYNTMAKDLGLTTFDGKVDDALLRNNLIFTRAKVHDPIKVSIPEVDAREWFGRLPPDLSLTARSRGPGWIYTYLKSFYADNKRPFGSNNLLIPDVSMPNVLAPLQGSVVAIYPKGELAMQHNSRLMLIEKGEMTEHQFDSALQDLVTFLVYVSEPAQLVRYHIGIGVLIFLVILSFLAYRLKKVYWRKIH